MSSHHQVTQVSLCHTCVMSKVNLPLLEHKEMPDVWHHEFLSASCVSVHYRVLHAHVQESLTMKVLDPWPFHCVRLLEIVLVGDLSRLFQTRALSAEEGFCPIRVFCKPHTRSLNTLKRRDHTLYRCQLMRLAKECEIFCRSLCSKKRTEITEQGLQTR